MRLLTIVFCLICFVGLGQKDSLIIQSKDSLSGLVVYQIVQDMPEFDGGTQVLMQYLQEKLDFTDIKLDSETPTTYYFAFIIDKNGNVVAPRCTNHPKHPIALRGVEIIANMPTWKAGKQKGKPVNVIFTLPLKIDLK